jgi:hypothetical protein
LIGRKAALKEQGFFQNLTDAGAGGPLAHVLGRLGGDQDGREVHMASPQAVDQLDPVHGGHVVIDHEASVRRQVPGGEEFLSAAIEAHVQALHLEGELQ